MTPEGRVRKHLRDTALRAGFEHRKLRWIGRVGAPDELLWWPEAKSAVQAVIALVEVKRLGKDLEPHQAREVERLRKGGWRVYVVDTKEGAELVIADLTKIVRSQTVDA